MATFFSDLFDVEPKVIEAYGAFNVSLINDLPLFIDPFLLFHSEKDEYVELHDSIINYLIFLRDKAKTGPIDEELLKAWYCFPEVKQNWLGFSFTGNDGSGLGIEFAKALHSNLHLIFSNFGKEKITEGSHLEKVCLIAENVGRDSISDFTTNLIKDFLCTYTEKFAASHIAEHYLSEVYVDKAFFNYETEIWVRKKYKLPHANGDYIILTPKDMLTRDENWINKDDLVHGFDRIPSAIPDGQLRAQISNYFYKVLAKPKDREPNKKERAEAARDTILNFPQLIDYYIKIKEQSGDEATEISSDKVFSTEYLFINQLRALQSTLVTETDFYNTGANTYEEAHTRLAFLKDVIENKGGHKLFYDDEGMPIHREKDLHILYRLVWFGTPSDVGREANDGRGPVDFKISRGAHDKTLVEMKLAKNSHLERNLEKQLLIYQAASDAKKGIKVIIFFTEDEEEKVHNILKKLGLLGNKDIIVIDARSDNKPSGSKA